MTKCDPSCGVGIAIVEDEKDLVKVYEKIFLKRDIFICFVAYDGLEAVKKFIECTPKPHVVLMDYRLPVMNGIDATGEILKIDPDTRIVFLSADDTIKDVAMRAGAFIFLKKPASIKDIVGAVEDAFRMPLQKPA
jgi:two-component system chemotaxis response regulator CheY